MILLLSLIFGIIPLLGVVWIVTSGWLATVDGLFMTLIFLTLSGLLLLNAAWEARARGLVKFGRKKTEPAKPPAAAAVSAKPQVPAAPTQTGTSQAQKAVPAPATQASTTPTPAAPVSTSPAQKSS